MSKRKTSLEVVSDDLMKLNKSREIYHLKGELARQLGIDMSGFFGMYPNNYQFALLSNLGSRELSLVQLVLRMTYESMCTEWFFTGTQLREFAQEFTPKINGRHAIPTGKDMTLSALGGIKELASRGFFIYEQVPYTSGNKTLHRVKIIAETITLENIADMKQINDGYHFLLGEANYHGLFDQEYSEIGIIAYNHLNKAVKDHKKSGTKMPVARNFNNYNAREKNIKHTKMPVDRNFNEPICGENGAEDLQKTIKDINKTTDTTFEKLDSLCDETKEQEKPTKENTMRDYAKKESRQNINLIQIELFERGVLKSKRVVKPNEMEETIIGLFKWGVGWIEAVEAYMDHYESKENVMYAKKLSDFIQDAEAIIKSEAQPQKKHSSAIDRAV